MQVIRLPTLQRELDHTGQKSDLDHGKVIGDPSDEYKPLSKQYVTQPKTSADRKCGWCYASPRNFPPLRNIL